MSEGRHTPPDGARGSRRTGEPRIKVFSPNLIERSRKPRVCCRRAKLIPIRADRARAQAVELGDILQERLETGG
jgi:hypothetical protein